MKSDQDQRILLMSKGVHVLINWLQDVVNQGVGQLSTVNPAYWESLAALMVDHKLGGLARRIRRFGTIIDEQDEWLDAILAEIGQLYLIAKGLSQIENYSPDIQAEILAQAGKSITKKDLLKSPSTPQAILVMGQSFGQEEQLSFRKTWYWLDADGYFAMELEFIVGRQSRFSPTLPTGSIRRADIFTYPSTLPSRILMQNSQPYSGHLSPKMLSDFSEMIGQFNQALGKNPWLVDFPCVIQNIHPILRRNEIFLADRDNRILEIAYKHSRADYLSLYAQKQPIDIFGTWNGQEFQAISAVTRQGAVFVL
ncbi:MAG TPA: hypothetical protein ENK85_00115 [Saprospiraceae bacterium]|nr:hypothetical protein [Saprospiraceae bacterium]